MPVPSCSDEEFINLVETLGPTETARTLGINASAVMARRRRVEERQGRPIFAPSDHRNVSERPFGVTYEKIITSSVEKGHILIGSDAHCWPHRLETAKRAFVEAAKKLQPKIVVLNGDVFDGASISKFPRIGWEWAPTIRQEMDAVQEFAAMVESAAPNAERIFTMGNHDVRFETFLANNAPQLEDMPFTTLGDFLPKWRIGWSFDLNYHSPHPITIKHRWAGGIHAAYNNALRSGVTFVTGHTHRLLCRPWTDKRGTRWGVEGGSLADPLMGDQFAAYSEMNPRDQQAGFVVLSFNDFEPCQPSLVRVMDEEAGKVEYNGLVYHV